VKKLSTALILTLVALLALGAFAYAQDGAKVTISPAAQSVEAGQQATVQVMIEDVSNLYGAEVHLSFDPTLLNVSSITPGAFPDPASGSVVSDYDNAAGTVYYAITLLAPAPAVDGSGVLCDVTFNALTEGISPVTITDAILADVQGAEIPVTTSNGEVVITIVPEIPEPGTLILLGSGLVGLAAFARRKIGK